MLLSGDRPFLILLQFSAVGYAINRPIHDANRWAG